MANQRVAGLIEVKANGEKYDAKGSFSYNLGLPLREAIVGSDGVHGFKETPQVAFIEGAITDRGNLDLRALAGGKDMTVSISLGNGKMVVLNEAWFAGEGTGTSEEAEVSVRWEGSTADEVS